MNCGWSLFVEEKNVLKDFFEPFDRMKNAGHVCQNCEAPVASRELPLTHKYEVSASSLEATYTHILI